MAELFGVPAGLLNDDRLGRALQALAPVAEQIRGELALAAATRCGADLSRLHLDMTAVRFTGGYDRLGAGGKGVGGRSQHRPPGQDPAGIHPHRGRGLLPAPPGRGQRGAVLGRRAGAPRASWPHPGSSVSPTPGSATCARLCAADAAGLRFVVPLRADTGWAHWFTADLPGGLSALPDPRPLPPTPTPPTHRPAHHLERRAARPRDRSTPTPAPPTGCASPTSGPPRRPASVAQARDRALANAEDALTRIRNGLRRALLQDPKAGRRPGRQHPRRPHRRR